MQPETHFATSFGEQPIGISQEQRPQSVSKSKSANSKTNPREAKFDTVLTAIVVGGTGQFVTFIFGLVTEFMPSMFDKVLLSSFIGLCIGLIAYVLMKGKG
ncbi:MAG TPA: hypothetical protein VGB07_13875 [Blastocatellia bacterium]|jgi:hypothetical protein